MELAAQTLAVPRGPHRIHAEVVPGDGVPVVLMHGFPDNLHLYDRLLPHLAARVPVVRFDFLGWGRSDKPAIDWALANPGRVAGLVLLNTYYHWSGGLRRPPAIAVFSSPVPRPAARAA